MDNKLADLSDENLLKTFENFNDIKLLSVAKVCKRFELFAKKVFSERYNGDSNEKYYEIKVFSFNKNDQNLHRDFLEIFGNEIAAIEIKAELHSNRYKFITHMGKYCRSAKHVIVRGHLDSFHVTQLIQLMSKLTSLTLRQISCSNNLWADIHYPHLKSFCVRYVDGLDENVLKRFMYINPQLENLQIIKCKKFPLKVIQSLGISMKRLKSLEYKTEENILNNDKIVREDFQMEQLETLKISVDGDSLKSVLETIAKSSKNIKNLKLWYIWLCESEEKEKTEPDVLHRRLGEAVTMFNALTSLHLKHFDLPIDAICDLVQHLPNLVSLKVEGVRLTDLSPNDVLLLFTTCKHLKQLSFYDREYCISPDRFDSIFDRKLFEFIGNRDIEFKVTQPLKSDEFDEILFTNEKLIRNGKLLHWTPAGFEALTGQTVHLLDLGDACLARIFSYLDEKSEQSLYETCIRMRDAIQDRIQEQLFTVHDINNAKDVFSRFGEHITKLSIDAKTKDREQIPEIWKLISENYGERIVELTLNNIRVAAMELDFKPKFSNLTKLNIMSLVS